MQNKVTTKSYEVNYQKQSCNWEKLQDKETNYEIYKVTTRDMVKIVTLLNKKSHKKMHEWLL